MLRLTLKYAPRSLGRMYGGVLRLIRPSRTLSLTTSLYFSYHSLNAPMKLSLSVTVMPFTSSSRFRDASISGSCVRYLRTMSIWWNWHIWTGTGFRACGSPFIPSITAPYILNPLLLSQFTPSTYWATVSCRTYLCHRTLPRRASRMTISPKDLPQ